MDRRKLNLRAIFGGLTVALLGLFGGGCALVDNELDLQYAPSADSPIQEIPSRSVYLEVMDLRPDFEQHRVGKIYNGYGAHTADIKLREPAVDEIRQAMVAELEAAGHRIVDSVDQAQVKVFLKVEEIDLRPKLGTWDVELSAEIEGDVSIYNPPNSRQPVSISASGSDVAREAMIVESTREEALNRALVEFIQSIVRNPQFINALGGPTAGNG
ncbi:MAG: YajG family lipoprotein [Verrucomicrobiota bacterium]